MECLLSEALAGTRLRRIKLTNILREKNAKVVIYDYCLSACANFSSSLCLKLNVMRKTVIAWHGTVRKRKSIVAVKALRSCGKSHREHYRPPQGGQLPENLQKICQANDLLEIFFKQRGVADQHVHEPQPEGIKKLFQSCNKARRKWNEYRLDVESAQLWRIFQNPDCL